MGRGLQAAHSGMQTQKLQWSLIVLLVPWSDDNKVKYVNLVSGRLEPSFIVEMKAILRKYLTGMTSLERQVWRAK